jgi:sulfite exporter TauE/SafE
MADSSTLNVLLGTAVAIAAGHTAIGVDHTLPFIALGRANLWSLRKVLAVTALCGIGHVLSSVVLGAVGIGLGAALERMLSIETLRGSWAAWTLIGFGGLFVIRGLLNAVRHAPHVHEHAHVDGTKHSHGHDHLQSAHLHPHTVAGKSPAAIWSLFIIFAFGPCEPLIPLVMAPAALHRWWWVALVTLVFGVVTIAVMLALVTVGHLGLSRVRLGALERHAELLAGLAIAGSGVAIQAFGL